MSLRSAYQFPFVLTSDGSMEIFPDNRTSKFQVMLKDPLDLGEGEWEVALLNINYPYTWTNVGPAAKVAMKFYCDAKLGAEEVNFPDWQCQSMGEVLRFIMADMLEKKRQNGQPPVKFILDELGRLKIKKTGGYYDLGFSDNMLKLLGLAGHELAPQLRMSSFEKRQRFRDIMDDIWREDTPFDYGDMAVREAIQNCESVPDFYEIISRHVDDEMSVFNLLAAHHPGLLEEYGVNLNSYGLELGFQDRRDLFRTKCLEILMKTMKAFFEEQLLPNLLHATTPGSINPVERMFVYINIIDPIDVNDKFMKLLKMLNTRGSSFKTTQEDFTQPMYLKVSSHERKISLMEVLIADANGDAVPFQSGTVVLTLLFRRVVDRRLSYY